MLSYPPDFLYEMKCDVFYAEYTSPNSTLSQNKLLLPKMSLECLCPSLLAG